MLDLKTTFFQSHPCLFTYQQTRQRFTKVFIPLLWTGDGPCTAINLPSTRAGLIGNSTTLFFNHLVQGDVHAAKITHLELLEGDDLGLREDDVGQTNAVVYLCLQASSPCGVSGRGGFSYSWQANATDGTICTGSHEVVLELTAVESRQMLLSLDIAVPEPAVSPSKRRLSSETGSSRSVVQCPVALQQAQDAAALSVAAWPGVVSANVLSLTCYERGQKEDADKLNEVSASAGQPWQVYYLMHDNACTSCVSAVYE